MTEMKDKNQTPAPVWYLCTDIYGYFVEPITPEEFEDVARSLHDSNPDWGDFPDLSYRWDEDQEGREIMELYDWNTGETLLRQKWTTVDETGE